MNTIPRPTIGSPEVTGFLLNPREVLAACGRTDAEDVFHYKHAWLKVSHITQKFTIEVSSLVGLEAAPVVGAVHSSHVAKPLAWRAPDNDLDVARIKVARQFLRPEFCEVTLKRVFNLR